MTIDLTLHQLQSRSGSPERAKEYGQLGYLQWLGSLPADACYRMAAMRAYATAKPIMRTDPAVAAFCALLLESIENPLAPLDLALPRPKRRGGARERRMSHRLMPMERDMHRRQMPMKNPSPPKK